ncbi:MAG: carboxypeptidase-like regulatory domain-containing protein [Bacteroidetes bacterium]|nr:carboxypeptidase-like regulatory domain-containing protein [Bacteroidota bacterium]
MKLVYKLAILFWCVALADIYFAQNSGVQISGKIVDTETGNPIIGANIIVERDSAAKGIIPFTGAASDQDGKYTTPRITNKRIEKKMIYHL